MLLPAESSVAPLRLRRVEYDQLVSLGAFEGEGLELIRGALIEMSPTRPSHAFVVQRLTRLLVKGIDDADVRVQSPFVAADESEPEPDVAIVPRDPSGQTHPSRAFLLVEVAESSLRADREVKGPLYAESDVDEYWIVAIERRQIEVHRDRAHGHWNTVLTVGDTATIAPLAFPHLTLSVAELLPPP